MGVQMQKRWCGGKGVFPSLALAGLLLAGSTQGAGGTESRSPAQGSIDTGALHPDAPPETVQFGRLVGVWQARQVSRTSDGSWSDDITTADWIWRYILDGHAIQDEWIVPVSRHECQGLLSGTTVLADRVG
jgi:hypothetical protein